MTFYDWFPQSGIDPSDPGAEYIARRAWGAAVEAERERWAEVCDRLREYALDPEFVLEGQGISPEGWVAGAASRMADRLRKNQDAVPLPPTP
jgi:hypothetical protein